MLSARLHSLVGVGAAASRTAGCLVQQKVRVGAEQGC